MSRSPKFCWTPRPNRSHSADMRPVGSLEVTRCAVCGSVLLFFLSWVWVKIKPPGIGPQVLVFGSTFGVPILDPQPADSTKTKRTITISWRATKDAPYRQLFWFVSQGNLLSKPNTDSTHLEMSTWKWAGNLQILVYKLSKVCPDHKIIL